jgi:hypothetical protein
MQLSTALDVEQPEVIELGILHAALGDDGVSRIVQIGVNW